MTLALVIIIYVTFLGHLSEPPNTYINQQLFLSVHSYTLYMQNPKINAMPSITIQVYTTQVDFSLSWEGIESDL
jgi:hypothetical protein